MERREFLAFLASGLAAQTLPDSVKADYTLHIGPVDLEIAPKRFVKTTGYNGSSPGPLLRLSEGKLVTIDVHNDTSSPELVHWHGLFISPQMDGSMEEGTPMIPAHGSARYSFTPRPSGTRWYHTHVVAQRNLSRGMYTGQFGFLYIDSRNEPGGFDAEVFLALRGWDAYFGTMASDDSIEVMYKSFSINSHSLGHGDPVRVKEGQKVMFRILNASATYHHRIALAGHKFKVMALDGNIVPNPREVETLELGPAERVDALVLMNQPGVWILGELDDKIRNAGLGIVVEYANRDEAPQWVAPQSAVWDYTIFGREQAVSKGSADVKNILLVFRQKFAGSRWIDNWTINGKSFPKTDPIRVRRNQRYRLQFDNRSDEAHPVHLHRHSFEVTNFAGKPTSGLEKDVIVVPKRGKVEVEFLADNPGPTLFHCHQQLHMDYGFMALIEYDA